MRIYVTGGTGLVGSNIIKLARENYNAEIIASQYGPEPEWAVDYELDPLDIRDHASIKRSVLKYKPDVVIHSAILLDLVYLTNNRENAWAMTVGSTRAFAEACREVNARLVFVSTDWVFDGTQPLVTEDSPPLPVNYYGIMKAITENMLAAMDGLNYGVGRLAGVYGLNYSNPSLARREQGLGFEIIGYVLERILREKVASIWVSEGVNDVAHPTLASDGAAMLLALARHEGNGIFHCFGSEAVSRLDFAHEIAQTFGADRNLIAPVPPDPIVLAQHTGIRIPFRIRASVEKTAHALGRTPLNVAEGLTAFKAERDTFNS